MFKLLQLSDCHLFADRDKAGYADISPFHSFGAVLEMHVDWQPDAILVTGDISGDDSAQSYQHFKARLAEHFHCKVHTLAGNHDNNAHYDDLLGEWDLPTLGPVRCGAWMLHGLDTRYRGTLGQIDGQRWQSVIDATQAHPDVHHLLALHHHPKPVGGWMDRHELLEAQHFLNSLTATPAIKAAVYGHIHCETQQRIEDTLFLSAPSTCWQFARSEDFGLAPEAPGARRLILHDDGHIETDVLRLPNGV